MVAQTAIEDQSGHAQPRLYLFQAVLAGPQVMLQLSIAALCNLILLSQPCMLSLQALQVILQFCGCASQLP